MVDVLRKALAMDFDEAVAHIEETIKGAGLSILLTKSIDAILAQKLGFTDYPRYTMILACAPELAKMALDVSKDAGNLFPCSFVVYEDEGKVMVSHISIMTAAVETGLAPAPAMEPVIQKTAELIHAVWVKI